MLQVAQIVQLSILEALIVPCVPSTSRLAMENLHGKCPVLGNAIHDQAGVDANGFYAVVLTYDVPFTSDFRLVAHPNLETNQ